MKKQAKKKIKIAFVKILVIGLAALLVFNLASANFFGNNTVEAVGDLNVNWGVDDGDPIFVVSNFLPGDSESRTVSITNGGTTTRDVSVRGIQTNVPENLEDVVDFVISGASGDIYGGTTGAKTLENFFVDAGGPNGLLLFSLASGETKTATFKATFDPDSGNEFQNTQVIFDLIIGLNFEIPTECEGIELSPNPIIGTSAAETLTGTPGNDLIMGLEGADHINGNDGDDCIMGGAEGDKINGNNGADMIFGEDGGDTIHGNNGEDKIFGGSGGDIIQGNNDNDLIVGGAGGDNLSGENGDDTILGNEDADSIEGGNGNDHLEGGAASDVIEGGNGDDVILGDDGTDALFGGSGDDNIDGGAGIDSADGNSGTDTCIAESESNCEL